MYQGLDVVIFSPLKRRWSEERQAFEGSKRQRVSKRNFVTIYGRAHRHVLTQDLVRTAFKKTGVWPFNANLVTKQMMAPSLETSSQGHLPLPQPSPGTPTAGCSAAKNVVEALQGSPPSTYTGARRLTCSILP